MCSAVVRAPSSVPLLCCCMVRVLRPCLTWSACLLRVAAPSK